MIIELTKREKQVLKLISLGYNNKEIGEKLFLSHKTIDNYRTNLLLKFNAKNSANLIMLAIKYKQIDFNQYTQ